MFPFPFYLITDPLLCDAAGGDSHPIKSLFEVVEEALAGGARLIQYRDKNSSRREKYQTAKRLRDILSRHGATLMINDDIDLASAVKAYGVHLGQEDLPLWVARKVLGKEALIGISAHSLQEAIQAEREGADYIGLGPIFQTQTKKTSISALGIKMISEVKKQVRIPLYAVGGIRLESLPDIISAGAAGVAVISGAAGEIGPNVAQWLTVLKSNEPQS